MLENAGGSLTIELPAEGSCLLNAKSSYGRIASGIDGLQIDGDAQQFQGPYRRGSRPKIELIAEGDISLGVAAPFRPQGGDGTARLTPEERAQRRREAEAQRRR